MNMRITRISHTTSETEKDDKDTYTLQAKNEKATISITQDQKFEGYTVGDTIDITIKRNQKTIPETT